MTNKPLIHLKSDTHLEFHRDGGTEFINSCPPADILVLAGDIDSGKHLVETLKRFAGRYADVVYVPGNHEFWGLTTDALYAKRAQVPSNVHWLYRDVKIVQGQRFLGSTLWYPVPPHRHYGACSTFSDYMATKGLTPEWVDSEHRKDVDFFTREVLPGDIAVTHHLPSEQFVAKRFRGNPYNVFFASNTLPHCVLTTPATWCFGHTHDSVDEVLDDKTRFVCNPFGYARHELNPTYEDECIL